MVKKIETSEPADPLDAMAAAADADMNNAEQTGAPGAPPEPEKPVGLKNEQCLLGGLQMIRETVCAIAGVQSPKVTLADDKLQPIAKANAEVLDKYGLSLSDMGGEYMVEIKAAIVTLPVLFFAYAALKAEMNARQKPATPATPAQATETPMAEVVEPASHATATEV